MKIIDNFHYKKKPSHAYYKIDTLCCEQSLMDNADKYRKNLGQPESLVLA